MMLPKREDVEKKKIEHEFDLQRKMLDKKRIEYSEKHTFKSQGT